MGADPWLLVGEGALADGVEVTLDAVEARHCVNVLRRGVGDGVILTDGAGRVAAGRLLRCSRCEVVVGVTTVDTRPRRFDGIGVAVGVLHTQAMDWAVQKAVEVGAGRFIPLVCGRSQGGVQRARGRLEHWRRVAEQALKQCRRPWRMPVGDPMTFDDCVGGGLAPGWVAHPGGRAVNEVSLAGGRDLMIGPEGGWTPDEDRALTAAGWPRVSLGPHVLRTETAVVVGAVLFADRLGSLRGEGGVHDA